MTLTDFIAHHAQRGPCVCGRCAPSDAPQPTGHTVDLVFFKVSAANNPDAEELKRLILAHESDYGSCNPMDGNEHGFMELGVWVGDQGFALMLMGLGAVLGLWTLLTPYTVLGANLKEELAMVMAGSGYVTIKASKPEQPISPP